MERREYIVQLKAKLKILACEIRANKDSHKKRQRERKDGANEILYKLLSKKYEYRHKHIAYCLLRGRTLEEIERPRENNKPSLSRIREYIKDYETLHPCS